MPPYFFAAERPNMWSSSLMVPPTAQRELWQLVSTYGSGNFSIPDAFAVWTIPTNVISWDAIASNLSFKCSISPEVLWALKMEQAIVPFFASSLFAAFPVRACTFAASDSGTISVPFTR